MKIKVTILIILMAGVAMAAARNDISFGGIKFVHAWSDNKEAITTHEYVESGRTLENWQHLLAYRTYPNNKEAASVINTYLKQIKPTEKPAIYNRSNSDVMLVFVMKAPDKSYLEFNIHRFVVEAGMVRSYQFAARNWKRDISTLTSEVKANKEKWMEAVGSLTLSDFVQK